MYNQLIWEEENLLSNIQELSVRNLEIFKNLVEAYIETGDPVGSVSLAERLNINLSPSTIRTVMAELVDNGLLYSPHISSGRVPTTKGLKFFLDGLLEIGDVSKDDRNKIDSIAAGSGNRIDDILSDAIESLSGLSNCAGLVFAPKTDVPFKHIEFIGLSPDRVLVILVTDDGLVENRIIETPQGWTISVLNEASNYLNRQLVGMKFNEITKEIEKEKKLLDIELDSLSSSFVKEGIAVWTGIQEKEKLIVRGHSKLLDDVQEIEKLEKIKELFDALEKKKGLIKLLNMAKKAEGVRIFLGSENDLFTNTGCSAIISPYMNSKGQIIGAVGVIGPSHINYAKIVPMVDYTARTVSHFLQSRISKIRKT